jgi:fructokinase
MNSITNEKLYGGIEAGGTKFVCAVAGGPDDIKAIETIPTASPEVTLGKAAGFFQRVKSEYPITALGIASFGPLDLEPRSPSYGCIVNTPKAGWSGTDLVGYFKDELSLPVALDTDVNGAALAEGLWGAARGLDSVVYLTVGTGIGGGGVINGRTMRGLSHPEMGHIRVPHDIVKDPFPGSCPYHGDCLEGLASGMAMKERWGKTPEEIPDGHPAWELEADYLAEGSVNYIYTLAPQRIIIGGGVMKKEGLLTSVREKLVELLNKYGAFPANVRDITEYIVAPGLGDRSGILGAITLAETIRE